MTVVFADTCTRVYSPNGAKAHLAAPGTVQPLCPARGRPPKGGWRGTGGPSEQTWADALETCQHCAKLAAARDTEMPPQVTPREVAPEPEVEETPAGSVLPGHSAGPDDADLAGTIAPAGPPGVRGPAFLSRWRAALAGNRAGQYGDRGRRARSGRSADYGPGQNRRGGGS